MFKMKFGSAVALLVCISTTLFSQEIVEFRGIGRTGHYNETGLLKKWPESGPQVLLKIKGIGKGYSQPVVADGKIFVTGLKKDTIDVLSAYDLTGQLIWETPYGRSWIRSYPDSRCTPTYENGRLYVSSGNGQVGCIDAQTGKIIWLVDAIGKYEGQLHGFGEAESLLIIDEMIVYTTGGEKNTMVALKKSDGTEVWKAKSLGGAKAYASPVLVNHQGEQIILAQTAENLTGINPKNGELLWGYNLVQFQERRHGKGEQTNPALYHNREVFVTSGYDHPATMFSIDENNRSVELKWKNPTLNTHHGGVVLVDGKLYGSNWQHNSLGRWVCVDWDTGETKWEEEWNTKGSIIFADGMLYLYEEKSGNVALVKPSPENLKIVSTFRVEEGEGPHWAHPAIYDGKLFIRHGEVLMVYHIKA